MFFTVKIWGFLKYYHPEVNKGLIDWDQQLTDITRKLPEVTTGKELSTLYLDWIHSLGAIPEVTPATSPSVEYFDNNFDLSWIRNDVFTLELTDQLKFIEQNRSQTPYYVTSGSVGQIEIIHETAYKAAQWSDSGVRLITLARYWNVIAYFYPYKYKADQRWDEILQRMIPRFLEVNTETEYHLLLHELTVSLGDSHMFFVTDSVKGFAGNKYIASRFKILNGKAVLCEFYDDSLARLDDLQLGDAVTKVDGVPVSEIYIRNEKYINGSNASVKQKGYCFRWIFNGTTDSVSIEFERNGVSAHKTIRRYERSRFHAPLQKKVKWKKVAPAVGYVNMEEVMAEDVPTMMTELAKANAIIFDFRNYPEFIIDELLSFLNPEQRGFAKFIQPDLSYPGRFVWTEVVTCGKVNQNPYKGRVIILVNEDTQSRSEYFVMAMQTVAGAVTVGRQTSGADGDVLDFTFFDDKTSWITGRGVFYPDWRETQRVGIKIDVEVPLSLEEVISGRDAILEKAVAITRTTGR